MALTAREWILLPKDEMEARKDELSKEECAKLRLELDMIHFSEEAKKNMTEEEKHKFTHQKQSTDEEHETFNKECARIFEEMKKEAAEKSEKAGSK